MNKESPWPISVLKQIKKIPKINLTSNKSTPRGGLGNNFLYTQTPDANVIYFQDQEEPFGEDIEDIDN